MMTVFSLASAMRSDEQDLMIEIELVQIHVASPVVSGSTWGLSAASAYNCETHDGPHMVINRAIVRRPVI